MTDQQRQDDDDRPALDISELIPQSVVDEYVRLRNLGVPEQLIPLVRNMIPVYEALFADIPAPLPASLFRAPAMAALAASVSRLVYFEPFPWIREIAASLTPLPQPGVRLSAGLMFNTISAAQAAAAATARVAEGATAAGAIDSQPPQAWDVRTWMIYLLALLALITPSSVAALAGQPVTVDVAAIGAGAPAAAEVLRNFGEIKGPRQ